MTVILNLVQDLTVGNFRSMLRGVCGVLSKVKTAFRNCRITKVGEIIEELQGDTEMNSA